MSVDPVKTANPNDWTQYTQKEKDELLELGLEIALEGLDKVVPDDYVNPK